MHSEKIRKSPLPETVLEKNLRRQIALHGPMDVGQFMGVAVSHYYAEGDRFGAGGDFTTAPEISQMFGEMLGAWATDLWMQMGNPAPFTLLECGPGRGTLMADMMRAAKFGAAAEMHLLETSPVLKTKQADALKDYKVTWHETLESVPDDRPMIVIGNEFLDALPARQFEYTAQGWRERVVGLDKDGGFVFGFIETGAAFPAAEIGDIFESSPAREGFVGNIAALLKRCGGGALFIDYGHVRPGFGDTLQAVKNHEYVPVLSQIGEADITSHVDFEALVRAAKDVDAWGPVEQGAFLEQLGIGQRAAMLSAKADARQQEDIQKALKRLTHSDEMGSLFKVMGLSYGRNIHPAGF